MGASQVLVHRRYGVADQPVGMAGEAVEDGRLEYEGKVREGDRWETVVRWPVEGYEFDAARRAVMRAVRRAAEDRVAAGETKTAWVISDCRSARREAQTDQEGAEAAFEELYGLPPGEVRSAADCGYRSDDEAVGMTAGPDEVVIRFSGGPSGGDWELVMRRGD